MTRSTSDSDRTDTNPFHALDVEWAIECRRHRRSTVVARWARRERALASARRLADVVPPPGADWKQTTEAVARLAADGDDLAARALLQLLLPGLIGVATKYRDTYGGTWAAGHEALAIASEYIARLSHPEVRCPAAGYVIMSVGRDLAQQRARDRTRRVLAESNARSQLRLVATASTEDLAISGALIRAVTDAARRGVVSQEAAHIVWMHAAGHPVAALATAAGMSVSQAYRVHARALAALRCELDTAS